VPRRTSGGFRKYNLWVRPRKVRESSSMHMLWCDDIFFLTHSCLRTPRISISQQGVSVRLGLTTASCNRSAGLPVDAYIPPPPHPPPATL